MEGIRVYRVNVCLDLGLEHRFLTFCQLVFSFCKGVCQQDHSIFPVIEGHSDDIAFPNAPYDPFLTFIVKGVDFMTLFFVVKIGDRLPAGCNVDQFM